MKLYIAHSALILATLSSSLNAQSPDSVSNSIMRFTISRGSGVFATNGQYFLLPNKNNSGYELVSISGDVDSSMGTYSYTKSSATSAVVVANDNLAGISIRQTLVFTSSNSGTFSHSNSLGSQSGTFTFDYRFSPSELGEVKANKVYVSVLGNNVDFRFSLYESVNLGTWTKVIPTNCVISDQISLRVSPLSGKRFYRLGIE